MCISPQKLDKMHIDNSGQADLFFANQKIDSGPIKCVPIRFIFVIDCYQHFFVLNFPDPELNFVPYTLSLASIFSPF